MEEKDKNQKVEELLDVEEKGKPVEKNKKQKNQPQDQKHSPIY